MDEEQLHLALSGGEGQTVEYKESFAELAEGIKTLSAFASQEAGGSVLFGVRDNGTPARGFEVGSNRPEKVASNVKETVISMTTGSSLLPRIFVFENPSVLALCAPTDAHVGGPYLYRGRRYERAGKSTHEVKVNYQQLVKAYHAHVWDNDSDEPMAYRCCPECGGTDLDRFSRTSPRDDMYYFVRCPCGWINGSE